MLPEAGATELIFLAAVALIVVGPKDLPVLMRKVGQFTAKMRGMAAEFRSSFEEMARQSELDELRKEVEALRQQQFASMDPVEKYVRDLHAEAEPDLFGHADLHEEEIAPALLPAGDAAAHAPAAQAETAAAEPSAAQERKG